MDRQRWDRLKSRFLAASRLPPLLRRPYVWLACRRDPELRKDLLRLLENAFTLESFLELKADTSGPRLPLQPPPEGSLPDLELLERIGQGGMGVVYKARQVSLGRTVAVKVLPDLLGVSESGREAFANESHIVAALSHPHIVPVYFSGQSGNSAYFAMEYVEGGSLDARISDARHGSRTGEFFAPASVARFVARLANALAATHAQGIAHRDIKPGNILVTREGEPKLVDFGLARPIERATLTSRIVGTPHYMSPEQARLQEARVDHRTDIYSLGVVMYEMLTRQRPFDGRTVAQVLLAIREREPVRVRRLNPAVPRDLETICHKAMRKRPEQRYASAAEFEDDLQAFLGHRSPRAQPPGLLERGGALLERHRVAAAAIALTLLLAVPAQWAGGRLIESARLAERIDALEASPPGPDGAEGDLDAAAARLRRDRQALADAAAIRAQAALLDDEDLRRLGAFESAVRAGLPGLRAALQDQVAANVQAGLSDAAGTDVGLLSRQATLLADVLELEGDERSDRSLASLLLPRVTLRTLPPGAAVFARRLDPATGLALDARWTRLGESDLLGLPLPPGYYRFVALGADGAYGEHTQLVAGDGTGHVLPDLVLRPTAEVERDMRRIAAGAYATSEADRQHRDVPGAAPLGEAVAVGAFLLDVHEVSNAQYRAFCEATGRRPPASAPPGDAAWDGLPAAFVDAYDAEAYAAWAGKRLPTKAEWLQALRGGGLRRYPWGDDPSDDEAVLARANLRGPDQPPFQPAPPRPGEPRDLAEYLARVRPVGSYPAGASAAGVLDLLGNLAEWTASISVNKVRPDLWRPEPGTRVVMGHSYWDAPGVVDSWRLVHSQATSCDIGIRCARTAPEELPPAD